MIKSPHHFESHPTGGKNIPVEQALNHIFGYAVGLDMTRRDLQNDMKKQGRPWCISKGFDHSATEVRHHFQEIPVFLA